MIQLELFKPIRKVFFATTILCSISAQAADHPIYMRNITNFARAIEDDQSPLDMEWIKVMRRQPIEAGIGIVTKELLEKINKDCNNKPYKVTTKWPTPLELKKSPTGDCRGFATCKYYALRKAGLPPEKLNLWSGDYMGHSHMVLVAEINNTEYVLDIGAEDNLPLAKDYFYKNFQPAYRFNENGWDVN